MTVSSELQFFRHASVLINCDPRAAAIMGSKAAKGPGKLLAGSFADHSRTRFLQAQENLPN